MKLNKRELATVLAALRHWQERLDFHSSSDREQRRHARTIMPAHFSAGAPAMCANDIDRLCDKINTKE